MSDQSPILGLPYLQASQAQKHVTHNEALQVLDVLVQPSVQNRSLTAAPALPAAGDRFIVAPGATGSWLGQSSKIAVWDGAAWTFLTPRAGWQCHIAAEGAVAVYSGTVWQTPSQTGQSVALLGVNANPDPLNPLTVSGASTLLNHDGAGHQLKLNKAAATDTASLMFQRGFSGRAEMGLAGSDDFSIKVSADGTTFATAMTVNRTSGQTSLPAGALLNDGTAALPALSFATDPDTGVYRIGANLMGLATGGVRRVQLSTSAMQVDVAVTGTAVTQTNVDTTAGRLLKVGDAGLLGTAPNFTSTDDYDAAPGGLIGNLSTVSVPLNAPVSNHAFAGLMVRSGSVRALQLLGSVLAAGALHWRGQDTSWSGWRRIFDQRSILGAVSQTSGVPTGAVIERGTNANGEYVRFADGLLICTQTLTGSTTAASSWTFPSAFIAAPVVTGTAQAVVLSCVMLDTAPTTTAASFSARDKADARRADICRMTAIGRWF